jgi:alpha-glucosidase
VPLPWTRTGSSFGFGTNGSHLPQPEWYGNVSVEAQDGVHGSTLELYREVMALRRSLETTEDVKWHKSIFAPNVLSFKRPNGWQNITNFGSKPIKLPKGKVLATSKALVQGKLAPNATAWIQA